MAASAGGAAGTADVDLMQGLCREDAEALAALMRRYHRLILRVAIDILRDPGEAEDVTQEVFLEIYRKAYQYDAARGSVRTWLLQYAYHRALRRKAALRVRAAYRGEPIEEAERPAEARRPGLTRQECRWMLNAAFRTLPDRQRAALELVCMEELSLRDVAERLDVSLGCARHYYYRGLARLRQWAATFDGRVAVEAAGVIGAPHRTRDHA